jgi:hypothetical protein
MAGVLQEAGIVYVSRTSELTTGLLVRSVLFIVLVCCVVVTLGKIEQNVWWISSTLVIKQNT